MGERTGECLGQEVIGVATDLTTVQGLSNLPTNNGLRVPCRALIQCALTADAGKGAVAVRWRSDGTDPTAALGMQLAPGQAIEIDSGLATIRFLGVAVNAKLFVSYYPATLANHFS